MSYISFRDSPHQFVITIGAIEPGDLMAFFQQEVFSEDSRTVRFHFNESQTWEDIAVFLQLQPSKSQARKNGWIGAVPWGYSELHRKLNWFYILNLDPSDSRTELL